MMSQNLNIGDPHIDELEHRNNMEYASLLKENGLTYIENEYFLIVGTFPENPNWLINISVVYPDIPALFKSLFPVLKSIGIPFRIPKDKKTAHELLEGKLGYAQFGKVVTLLPYNDQQAAEAVNVLKRYTKGFIGPVIPTAAPVGDQIYVQYVGKIEFSDSLWPFEGVPPREKIAKKVFNQKYKIIDRIKSDLKGDVFKGRYLKGPLLISSCIIKEGRRYMWTDEGRRDMSDRLKWQLKLLNELSTIINVPKGIDLFTDEGNTYLVMEYIKGPSFLQLIPKLYKNCNWGTLNVRKRKKILNYLIQILKIVDALHRNGYVHRDVTPGNFILNKHHKIVLVDMELTYSISTGYPDPPFGKGTLGFISPEQHFRKTPTPYEDIYALAGMMTFFFGNKLPAEFRDGTGKLKVDELNNVIRDNTLTQLIIDCYQRNPEKRPSIEEIRYKLEEKKRLL